MACAQERFCTFHEGMRTLTARARTTLREVIDALRAADAAADAAA